MIDEVVLILPQHRADLLERADDRELLIADADDLARAGRAREELVAPCDAPIRQTCAAWLIFRSREVAALIEVRVSMSAMLGV